MAPVARARYRVSRAGCVRRSLKQAMRYLAVLDHRDAVVAGVTLQRVRPAGLTMTLCSAAERRIWEMSNPRPAEGRGTAAQGHTVPGEALLA